MTYGEQVAWILGVQIAEVFEIKGHPELGCFWFSDKSLINRNADMTEINTNDILAGLISGDLEIEKAKTDENQERVSYYILDVIKLVRNEEEPSECKESYAFMPEMIKYPFIIERRVKQILNDLEDVEERYVNKHED